MTDIVVRLKRQIAPIVFGKSETVHGVIVDSIAEIERLRTALQRIAADGHGLQGIIEDYGHDTNAYNYHAMEYWFQDAMRRRSIARDALEPRDEHPDQIQTSNK